MLTFSQVAFTTTSLFIILLVVFIRFIERQCWHNFSHNPVPEFPLGAVLAMGGLVGVMVAAMRIWKRE